jgi:hypothetical protein
MCVGLIQLECEVVGRTLEVDVTRTSEPGIGASLSRLLDVKFLVELWVDSAFILKRIPSKNKYV